LPLVGGSNAYVIGAFGEKPDAAIAERFLKNGGYNWNSGMFMVKASTYMEELRRHEPEIARQAELALQQAKHDNDFVRLDADALAACPSVSVGCAVMERGHGARHQWRPGNHAE
jgi:mannose-1-phosphate guanylyltransferase/mannose-6-phosphate isomerase